MTANEYLSKFKLLNTVIKQLEQERQSLVAFVNGEYPKCKDHALSLLKDVEETIHTTTESRNKIITQIQGVDNDNFRNVIVLRYMYGLNFEDIARELKFSNVYTRKLHSKALKGFENQYPEILQEEI